MGAAFSCMLWNVTTNANLTIYAIFSLQVKSWGTSPSLELAVANDSTSRQPIEQPIECWLSIDPKRVVCHFGHQ